MTTVALPLPRVRWRGAAAAGRRALSRAPLASGFAVVLLGTTIALRHLVSDDQAVLHWASTNIDNLATRPLRVIVTSALFLPGEFWLPYAAAIGLTMAPLERRYGPLRTLAVFLSGHVLATLITEGGVAAGIAAGMLPVSEAGQLDVGVSYGIWTSAGAALLLVPRRWRLPVGVGTALAVLVPLLLDPDMTTIGHTLCFAIGLAWWPVLRRTPARRAARPAEAVALS